VLHIGLHIQKVLGWRGIFATGADRIHEFRINRQGGFQSDIAHPVRVIVIDIAKPLALAKLELIQRGTPRIGSAGAIVFPIDMEVVEMLIAPLKEDLNDIVELGEGGGVVYQNPTPDERTDASQDNA
jgi:hypothetical protein